MRFATRAAAVIAGLWAGILLCIGAIAAPAAFATLARGDAGRFVGKLFEREAYLSLAIAVLLFMIERHRVRVGEQASASTVVGAVFSVNLMLVLGALFCTVAGYFAVQPLMAAARAGQGGVPFGVLHALSSGFFLVKGLLVLTLVWRLVPLRSPATTS